MLNWCVDFFDWITQSVWLFIGVYSAGYFSAIVVAVLISKFKKTQVIVEEVLLGSILSWLFVLVMAIIYGMSALFFIWKSILIGLCQLLNVQYKQIDSDDADQYKNRNVKS